MKKQIKLVVAVFAIMLVGVTSAFAQKVKADDFGVIPGVYECGELKVEFWVGSDNYIHWTYSSSGTLEWLGTGNWMTFYDGWRHCFKVINRTTLEGDDELIFKLTKPAKGSDLLSAILDGYANFFLFKMIDDGADVNYRACGTTPMHEAARTGNFPLAMKLRKKGAGLYESDKNGKWPKEIAKEKGYTELANYLDSPASFKSPDPISLIEAASAGALKAVKKEVSLGVDLDAPNSSDGWTALTIAAANGNTDVVTYLVDMGANVNKPLKNPKDGTTATALYYAARKGNLDCVELLVRCGADLNTKHSKTGKRPLQIAQENKHTEVVEYLKEQGAY